MRKTINFSWSVIVTLVTLGWLSTSLVMAHSSGYFYEVSKDGYKVDIGYNSETPIEGDRLRFDFQLEEEDVTDDEELFTDVWVSIKRENEIYFSGNIHRPEFGPTGINLVLGEAGEYVIAARYQKTGEKLVEATFSLVVQEGEREGETIPWYYFAPIVLLFLFLGTFLYNKKKGIAEQNKAE